MSKLQYEIVRALYTQAVFNRVESAYDAADAVINALGLQDRELESADG